MNTYSNYENFKEIRTKTEARRQQENRPHEVLYFHKVDDPYSHLTIQCIEKFKSSFNVIIKKIADTYIFEKRLTYNELEQECSAQLLLQETEWSKTNLPQKLDEYKNRTD
jgi:hypothetical protein